MMSGTTTQGGGENGRIRGEEDAREPAESLAPECYCEPGDPFVCEECSLRADAAADRMIAEDSAEGVIPGVTLGWFEDRHADMWELAIVGSEMGDEDGDQWAIVESGGWAIFYTAHGPVDECAATGPESGFAGRVIATIALVEYGGISREQAASILRFDVQNNRAERPTEGTSE